MIRNLTKSTQTICMQKLWKFGNIFTKIKISVFATNSSVILPCNRKNTWKDLKWANKLQRYYCFRSIASIGRWTCFVVWLSRSSITSVNMHWGHCNSCTIDLTDRIIHGSLFLLNPNTLSLHFNIFPIINSTDTCSSLMATLKHCI